MDFLTNLFGDEASAGMAAAGKGTGDMAGNPATQGSHAQQSTQATQFGQLMQQIMQMNAAQPNMAQQAMQQAQSQSSKPMMWNQLLQ